MTPGANRRLLVIFVLIVACALLLGVRSEVAWHRIDENTARIDQLKATEAYEDCLRARTFYRKYNTSQHALAQSERDLARLTRDPERRQIRFERARVFDAFKIPVSQCIAP